MINAAKSAYIKDDLQAVSQLSCFTVHPVYFYMRYTNIIGIFKLSLGCVSKYRVVRALDWTSVHNYAHSKTMHAKERIQRTHSNPFSL